MEPSLERLRYRPWHGGRTALAWRWLPIARSGLRNPEKPIGCFLFAGPTGVGKTELARQLSKTLGIELLRYDMSEYGERHTVSRLIGAPPGYVGFDQGGLLTDAVRKHPHSVVVLDEIPVLATFQKPDRAQLRDRMAALTAGEARSAG